MADIVEIDHTITLAINQTHSQFWDWTWQMFSDIKLWYPVYALLAYVLIRRFGWKKGGLFILSLILGLVACDQTANLFKNSVGRLRPCYNLDMITGGLRILESRGGHFGFFSAHAANFFSLACISSIEMRSDKSSSKGYAFLVFFWAVCVSASRIFVGKHFFGDVLVGILVGTIIGTAIGMTSRYISDKYSFFKV